MSGVNEEWPGADGADLELSWPSPLEPTSGAFLKTSFNVSE